MLTIRHGASRTVLLTRRLAFKLPRLGAGWRAFLWGLLSNLAERQRFRSGAHPALCPILASLPGGWLVVMPRAEPLTPEQWSDVAEAPGPLFEAAGFDFKPCSFGTLGGRVVALDYHANV